MKAVYKYGLDIAGSPFIEMPLDAEVLCVQVQGGHPMVWALVAIVEDGDTQYAMMPRQFRLAGTGHPLDLPDTAAYVGTFQLEEGAIVFHLFEVNP